MFWGQTSCASEILNYATVKFLSKYTPGIRILQDCLVPRPRKVWKTGCAGYHGKDVDQSHNSTLTAQNDTAKPETRQSSRDAAIISFLIVFFCFVLCFLIL